MRKSLYLIISMIVILSALPQAQAQPMPPHRGPGRPHKEMLNPEQTAQKKAKKMQDEVGLDEKQYKKIYKIYLKEEQAKKEAAEGRMMPPPGGFPGGGPGGFPGGMPMGGPGGGFPSGGFPPQGMGPGMGHGTPPPGAFGGMEAPTVGGKAIDSDEYIEAREKKFKKILTPDQYKLFRTIHPDPSGFFIE